MAMLAFQLQVRRALPRVFLRFLVVRIAGLPGLLRRRRRGERVPHLDAIGRALLDGPELVEAEDVQHRVARAQQRSLALAGERTIRIGHLAQQLQCRRDARSTDDDAHLVDDGPPTSWGRRLQAARQIQGYRWLRDPDPTWLVIQCRVALPAVLLGLLHGQQLAELARDYAVGVCLDQEIELACLPILCGGHRGVLSSGPAAEATSHVPSVVWKRVRLRRRFGASVVDARVPGYACDALDSPAPGSIEVPGVVLALLGAARNPLFELRHGPLDLLHLVAAQAKSRLRRELCVRGAQGHSTPMGFH
mmetsp:Transcript_45687/g.131745  ORF Transcript_45687/g.131745 Transcript_45687/m.131745 type:complete len:305 (-) Transcript_45687:738-1652(-)